MGPLGALRSKSADLAPAPTSGPTRPTPGHTTLRCEGLRPSALPKVGVHPHTPMGGPTRPTPGVPFVSRRKEPKACRGCAPGPCQCKMSALIGAALPLAPGLLSTTLAPGLLSTTNPDRFATLGWWANRSLFLPKLYRGSHPQLSIRGTAGLASRMLEGLSYRNQYR